MATSDAILFDTNVLIAALFSDHSMHAPCLAWFKASENGAIKAAISQHLIGEAFAAFSHVLRIAKEDPALAGPSITSTLRYFECIPLDCEGYRDAVGRLANAGLAGAAIYDLVHLIAAERAGIGRVLTANTRDFERLPTQTVFEFIDPTKQGPPS